MTGWVDRAACRGRDYRLWFSSNAFEQSVARSICAGCPVRRECLADAVAVEDPARRFGMFGGMTANERGAFTTADR